VCTVAEEQSAIVIVLIHNLVNVTIEEKKRKPLLDSKMKLLGEAKA